MELESKVNQLLSEPRIKPKAKSNQDKDTTGFELKKMIIPFK
jgi:hypothetical protein